MASDEREWWEVKQKLEEKREKKKKSLVSDMNGEIYLKGTLSFALAHTQACYKDSEPFTLFTYRGFLFKFQWPKNGNKQGEAVNQSITQSINLRYKQNTNTKLYCHFDE